MDISRNSSISLNSTNLPRVMILRTVNDEHDDGRREKQRILYEERKRRRLESSGAERLEVSFSTVEVREYPIILGDNPAVSEGPPMEIGWRHFDEQLWSFEVFEKTHPPRRSYLEMNVPMDIRIQILQRCGESYKSIIQRSKAVKAMRIKRLETTQQLYKAKSEERLEKVGRGLRNLFSDKKKRERDLMERTKSLSELPDEDLDEYEMELMTEIDHAR